MQIQLSRKFFHGKGLRFGERSLGREDGGHSSTVGTNF